jgi:hypothetical protein
VLNITPLNNVVAGFIPACSINRGVLGAGINPAPTAARGQSLLLNQTSPFGG